MLAGLSGWRQSPLLGVCLAIAAETLLYGVTVPTLPIFGHSLGLDTGSIGLLHGGYAVGLLLSTLTVGELSDRFGRALPRNVGFLLLALSAVMFAFAGSFWALLGGRIVQGVGGSLMWVTGLAALADSYPPSGQGRAFGVTMSVNSVGLMLGPPIGGVLYDAFGLRLQFLMTACAVGACWVATQRLLGDVRGETRASRHGNGVESGGDGASVDAEDGRGVERGGLAGTEGVLDESGVTERLLDGADAGRVTEAQLMGVGSADMDHQLPAAKLGSMVAVVAANPSTDDEPIAPMAKGDISYRRLLRNRQLVLVIAVTLVMAGVETSIEPTLPWYLHTRFGLNSGRVGATMVVTNVASGAVSLLVGPLTTRLGVKSVVLGGMALVALSLPLLSLPAHPMGVAGVLVVFGMGVGACGTAIPTDLAALGSGAYASAYGFYSGAWALGMLTGPPLAGFVMRVSTFGMSNVVPALACVACGLAYWLRRHEAPRVVRL